MPATIQCQSCRAAFPVVLGPCPQCGGPVDLSVCLTGVEAKGIAGHVGTVADSPTPLGGQQIKYTAPTGSRSDASLVGDLLAIQVKPPVDVGRPGEPRVLACIVAYLAKAGKESTTLEATDQVGEDGVLEIHGDRVTVQIVTATPSAAFWRGVAKGHGEVQAELAEAVNWIHSAVVEKAKLYPKENKSSMLLAIDVGHMGVLASSKLRKLYLKTHGDPSACFGFGAVLLIGPTENYVHGLGNSRW